MQPRALSAGVAITDPYFTTAEEFAFRQNAHLTADAHAVEALALDADIQPAAPFRAVLQQSGVVAGEPIDKQQVALAIVVEIGAWPGGEVDHLFGEIAGELELRHGAGLATEVAKEAWRDLAMLAVLPPGRQVNVGPAVVVEVLHLDVRAARRDLGGQAGLGGDVAQDRGAILTGAGVEEDLVTRPERVNR